MSDCCVACLPQWIGCSCKCPNLWCTTITYHMIPCYNQRLKSCKLQLANRQSFCDFRTSMNVLSAAAKCPRIWCINPRQFPASNHVQQSNSWASCSCTQTLWVTFIPVGSSVRGCALGLLHPIIKWLGGHPTAATSAPDRFAQFDSKINPEIRSPLTDHFPNAPFNSKTTHHPTKTISKLCPCLIQLVGSF